MTNFKSWLKAAAVRAVKTFAQVAASLLTVDGLAGGFEDFNWVRILSVAGVAFVYSLVTSIAGLPEVKEEQSNG